MQGVGRRRRGPVRAAIGVVATGTAFLLGAAPAPASFVAVSEAPAGNTTDPSNPGRDLTAAGLGYNRTTGVVYAAIRLAGAPTEAQAYVGMFAGTRGPSGCNVYPAVGITAFTFGGEPRWGRIDAPTAVQADRATMTGRGETIQTFRAQDDRLKGLRPNCALITLSQPDVAEVVYDTIGPLDLVAQPDLGVKFTGVPEPFTTGRSREVRVEVRNGGDAESGRTQMRFRSARGVTVRPSTITVPSIRAGGKRTVKVRVTPSSRAATRTDLAAIVGKPPVQARAEAKVWHRKRSTPTRGGGGGGAPRGSQVCTRWFPDLSGESGGSLGLVPC